MWKLKNSDENDNARKKRALWKPKF